MENDKNARNRAHMPEGTSSIINRRSLKNSHRRLSELLEAGNDVLDVGCGMGAITSGIARTAWPGKVIGIDENEKFIAEANRLYSGWEHLSFERQDIYKLNYNNQFDVVTSARVLQWLSDPEKALGRMVAATKSGGSVVVLDYNHEKIKWVPEPPKSMQTFYEAFLRWRYDAGMDNCIADHLSGMFSNCGLDQIEISIQHEETVKNDTDFNEKLDIWAGVAESRGLQLVEDGYIDENERVLAIEDYREWIAKKAEYMQMYLLAVSGKKY